jgi:hypothetical protein
VTHCRPTWAATTLAKPGAKLSTLVQHDHYLTVTPGRTGADAGTRTRTYRLQDASSVLTIAATSDFTIYSDRSGDSNGTSGRQFVSQPVSRPPCVAASAVRQ